MKKSLKIAIYMRISKEDERRGTQEQETESGSIQHQRLLLERYVAEHFEEYDLEEYRDV